METTKKLEKSVSPAKPSIWTPVAIVVLVSSIFANFVMFFVATEADRWFWRVVNQRNDLRKENARLQSDLDKMNMSRTSADSVCFNECWDEGMPLSVPVDVLCLQESQDMCFPHLVGPIYNYMTGRWESCPVLMRGVSPLLELTLTRFEDACLAESLYGDWNRRFVPFH